MQSPIDPKEYFDKKTIYHHHSNIIFDENEGRNYVGIPLNDYEFGYYRVYIIKAGEEYRPDIISQKFYNTPDLDWYICLANFIKDPLSELYAGRKIVVPEFPIDLISF